MKILILALLPAVALGQLLGGVVDATVNPNSVPVQFALKTVNEKLAAEATTAGLQFHPLQLLEITKAQTQVVAGMNYFLTLHLSQDYVCDVTVWYRSWMGDDALQVTDGPTCNKGHAVRALVGGISSARPLPSRSDSDEAVLVLNALQTAACLFNDRSNNMFASKLGDTSGVTYTQQVTAGITYRFYNVQLQQTHCRNNGCANMQSTLAGCAVTPLGHGGMTTKCSLVVQSQVWMDDPIKLIDMTCSN